MVRRRRTKKRRQRVIGPKFILFIFTLNTLFLTLLMGGMIIGYLLLGLPDIASLKNYAPPAVTEVLDRTGAPMAYWYKEKRWPLPLDQIPERLRLAFMAAEDARFYEHPGIDFIGVLRAMIKNVEAGTIVQGASTITQQVTRALLLSPKRTWSRKLKEAILAWQIDSRLTKDEILTIYLNHIYLGEGAYGVEAAARTYFGKHAKDLNLAECALLAGLPQAPSRYNPKRHLDRAKRRQAYVLKRMAEEGFVKEEEARQALRYPLKIKGEQLNPPPGAGYFIADLKKELLARYGKEYLFTAGLKIRTTLDPQWQAEAYDQVEQGVQRLLKRHPKDKGLARNVQAALVAMDLHTGAVRAMVGGKDFQRSQFNLATQARVQPGSSFKPIVYSAAMEAGLITPNTVLVDEPIALPGPRPGKPWRPENFEKTYLGPITIRTALTLSRNVIAVKVARMVGVKAIRETARRMGITAPIANNLSIALGSSAIPLIQLVTAYTTFGNEGSHVEPRMVEEIRDRYGRVIQRLEPRLDPALKPVVAYQMLNLLKGVVESGTGQYAKRLGMPAAGKTGTTDNYHDALFLGLTPAVACGVWVGRKDHLPLGRLETGGRVACPIWTEFLKRVLDPEKVGTFPAPRGVVLLPVEKKSGDPAGSDNDEKVVWEVFRDGDAPELTPPPSALPGQGLPPGGNPLPSILTPY